MHQLSGIIAAVCAGVILAVLTALMSGYARLPIDVKEVQSSIEALQVEVRIMRERLDTHSSQERYSALEAEMAKLRNEINASKF